MAKQANGGKLIVIVVILIVAAAAAFGYFNQTSQLSKNEGTVQKLDEAVLATKPNDIIMGDINALTTVVEYSSLSCPHCGHFHEKVLPTIEKEFLTTGKVKLIFRHFPLNEPALRAAQIVECAGNNGQKRENFLRVFFSMQNQWAFSENFLDDLKKIALVGGMDSAAFDSCIADKELETRILNARQNAETKLGVNATPRFFINNVKYEGEVSVEGLRNALKEAGSDE